MAAKALQPFEAVEGRTQTGHEVDGADVTQVVRGERREQEQADVRRRRIRRDLAQRRFLVVIRRQPVVIGPDKVLKEQPRAPREAAQGHVLGGRERRSWAPDRLADAQDDFGRQDPAEKQRKSDDKTRGPEREHEDGNGCGQEHPAQHEAPRPPPAQVCALGRLRGGEPFQQAPSGHHDAHQARDDRSRASGLLQTPERRPREASAAAPAFRELAACRHAIRLRRPAPGASTRR